MSERYIGKVGEGNAKEINENVSQQDDRKVKVIKEWRSKLEEFQSTMLNDMHHKTMCIIDDLIKEMEYHDFHKNEFHGFGASSTENTKLWVNRPESRKRMFADKVFKSRDSLLTYLMEVSHIRALYRIFLIMLFLIALNTAISEYLKDGRINFGQHTIYRGMQGFWWGIGIWLIMQLAVLLPYFGLKYWATVRINSGGRKTFRQFRDIFWIIALMLFQVIFMSGSCYAVIKLNLAPVPSFAVLIENIRFVMKTHAFVREMVPRLMQPKHKTDDPGFLEAISTSGYPKISQFLYYLFAPTFIYRDHYPRTSRIDWKFAFHRLFEVIGFMFFVANIQERYILPSFESFGRNEISLREFWEKFFDMIVPSSLMMISGFYAILHSWLNFVGELLRFADRMFYRDWWNAANYVEYFRNWNIVVHDWLYEFVYKDSYLYVFRGSKKLSFCMVFIISALFHEYLLAFPMRFCYPVMFGLFGGLSLFYSFVTRKMGKIVGNYIIWWGFLIGNVMVIVLYAMEMFARYNCRIEDDSWKSYFIPISWCCNGIKWS